MIHTGLHPGKQTILAYNNMIIMKHITHGLDETPVSPDTYVGQQPPNPHQTKLTYSTHHLH